MTNCGSQPLDANVASIGLVKQGAAAPLQWQSGSRAGALENGAQETGSIFNDW